MTGDMKICNMSRGRKWKPLCPLRLHAVDKVGDDRVATVYVLLEGQFFVSRTCRSQTGAVALAQAFKRLGSAPWKGENTILAARSLAAIAIVFSALGLECAQSQISRVDDYPNHSITIIVPAPVGGPTNLLARIIGDKLRAAFGYPSIVDNRPGAIEVLALRRSLALRGP